jgi:NADPH-dependent 2,4-dienoyl-CoA reductase/sulfur reductase-like enzyme
VSAGVLIAGGGLAGQRCAETLRRRGWDGPITVICAEPRRPYDRPPLSKDVLGSERAEERLSLRPQAWYEENRVELLLGTAAASLDPRARTVGLADGRALRYERLLIATGARPRRLSALTGFRNVSALRTLADARQLRGALQPGARLLVIGAGFIGQEVAAAACKVGAKTTLVEAAPLPLASLLGSKLGSWLAGLHRESGVELALADQVAEVRGSERVGAVRLASGRTVRCDHVLVAVGVDPDLDWLAGSGLERDGVRTDADCRTRAPGVWAAGDAAAQFDPALAAHIPGGHWESAARQGARAARSMLGLSPAAESPASFWSDLYGTRIQYLGHAPLADAVMFDGDPGGRDFAATYTRDGRPVAVLLAGRPHMLPQARELLTTNKERSSA